jgi:hypothetical protein
MADSVPPYIPHRNNFLYDKRVAMLGFGWPTITCERKIFIDPGWSTVEIDLPFIQANHARRGGSKWRGAGVRLTPGMMVWDLDIKDRVLMDAVLDAIEADPYFSTFLSGALWRHSGGASWALFMQASAPIAGKHSATFGREATFETTDEALENHHQTVWVDKAHIEIWGGGGGGKYFAVCGPHSEGREYDFDGPAPWDTPLSSLPVFDVDQVGRLIDLVEAVMAKTLTKISDARSLDGLRDVYDLTPQTTFVRKDRSTVTLAELERTLRVGTSHGERGCMTMQEWVESDSHARCHAYRRETNKRLTITNFFDMTQHYYVDEEPAPPFQLSASAAAVLKAMLDNAQSEAPTEPEPEAEPDPHAWIHCHTIEGIKRETRPVDTHDNATAWLITHVAYYAQAFKSAPGGISISVDGEYQKPVSIVGLRHAMKAYGYILEGPRGGQRFINPVDTWLASEHLVRIGGVRMRPDLPRPMMQEGTVRFVNRYAPPSHPTSGGEVRTWLRNMERLIPDPIERAWVINFVACKVQHPEWRMVGLAMVAHEHGTGRGLFAETLQYLFGEQFVVPLRYDDITASPRFNGEVEDRLIVYVNEARHADSNRYGVKTASREALKVFIEPNHRIPQRIEKKGIDVYFTHLALMTLIFANSIKAVPIDEHDRRTGVVMNGAQMTTQQRDEYQAWMLVPANIGALYRFLRDYAVEKDRKIFDPFMAPMFVGRDMMIEATQSEIDRAWAAAVARLKDAADLYAMSQAVALARSYMSGPGDDLTGLLRNHTYDKGHRIGVKRPSERNWLTRFGTGKDNRQAVFAHNAEDARVWTSRDSSEILAELEKAQKVIDAPAKAVNKALKLVPRE